MRLWLLLGGSLFRKSLAFSSRDTFNDHSGVERWACAVRIVGDVVDKIEVDAIFLLPFQEFTLEVHLLIATVSRSRTAPMMRFSTN